MASSALVYYLLSILLKLLIYAIIIYTIPAVFCITTAILMRDIFYISPLGLPDLILPRYYSGYYNYNHHNHNHNRNTLTSFQQLQTGLMTNLDTFTRSSLANLLQLTILYFFLCKLRKTAHSKSIPSPFPAQQPRERKQHQKSVKQVMAEWETQKAEQKRNMMLYGGLVGRNRGLEEYEFRRLVPTTTTTSTPKQGVHAKVVEKVEECNRRLPGAWRFAEYQGLGEVWVRVQHDGGDLERDGGGALRGWYEHDGSMTSIATDDTGDSSFTVIGDDI